jgi:hypothetical protein
LEYRNTLPRSRAARNGPGALFTLGGGAS